MTQHLVNDLVVYFVTWKEVTNMKVKEIFRLIMLNDNVSIIDHKNYYRYWSGQGKDIPLRYCNYEVKHIYSELQSDGDVELVIAIIV